MNFAVIKEVPTDSIIIHTMWESAPNGYDEVTTVHKDYLIEDVDIWWSEEEFEEWKREIREFITEQAAKYSHEYWEKIEIWYDLPIGEVNKKVMI